MPDAEKIGDAAFQTYVIADEGKYAALRDVRAKTDMIRSG